MYEREESHKQFKYIKYRCISISDDFKSEQTNGRRWSPLREMLKTGE